MVESVLTNAGIDVMARGETLSAEQFVLLSDEIHKLTGGVFGTAKNSATKKQNS